MGENFEAVGAVVNMSGGSMSDLSNAFMGSLFNISGGSIGSNFTAARGSVVNVTGGTIGELFEVQAGAAANLSGGAIDRDFQVRSGGQLRISGGEFRLNGAPISGLNGVGTSRAIDIPSGTVLSGTFSDGTPFAFSDQDYNFFAAGTLTLSTTTLPSAGPAMFQVPHDPTPKGLRSGQSLIVENGGHVGDHFNAAWGSAVTINGGEVGSEFQALGSFVNITGGNVGPGFSALYGTAVNITGGTVGSIHAERGSVVNLSGGSVPGTSLIDTGSVVNVSGGCIGPNVYLFPGAALNLSGGSIGDNLYMAGGTVNMTGGAMGKTINASPDSVINLSGGTIGHDLYSGGRFVVVGTDFRIDGTPVSFDYIGEPKAINLAGSVLSGTLQDGTPFSFSGQLGDIFDSLNVELSYGTPPVGPAVIQIPTQSAPAGIRAGQTLVLGNGGTIGDRFRMGWGSTLTVTGGKIGDNLEAVGAQVTVAGGAIGNNFAALYGSTVNVSAGKVGDHFTVGAGATVNVTGGMVSGLLAESGSIVNISGGVSGTDSFGRGILDSFGAAPGSEIHFFGTGFELDGVPIANLVAGEMITIADRLTTLSGILADGSPFRYFLEDGDFDRGEEAISLHAIITVTSVLYGDYNGDGVVDMADYVAIRAGLGTKYTAADWDTWRSHFGETARFPATGIDSASVPEPRSEVLFTITAAVCALFRSSRRKPALRR